MDTTCARSHGKVGGLGEPAPLSPAGPVRVGWYAANTLVVEPPALPRLSVAAVVATESVGCALREISSRTARPGDPVARARRGARATNFGKAIGRRPEA